MIKVGDWNPFTLTVRGGLQTNRKQAWKAQGLYGPKTGFIALQAEVPNGGNTGSRTFMSRSFKPRQNRWLPRMLPSASPIEKIAGCPLVKSLVFGVVLCAGCGLGPFQGSVYFQDFTELQQSAESMEYDALFPVSGREQSPDSAASAPEPFCVILYVVDSLRADHLELYGYERKTAPTLAAIARESVVFTRCFSAANWTLPSVGTLLTGRYAAAAPAPVKRAILPDGVRFTSRDAEKAWNMAHGACQRKSVC